MRMRTRSENGVFDFGICTSYDVSGYSLKKYPKNFNKGMQPLGKSKINNNAANRSKSKLNVE